MLRFIRDKGFEIEKIYPGYFVLQAAVAGFFSSIVLLVYIDFQLDLSEHLSVPQPLSYLLMPFVFQSIVFAFLAIFISAVVRTVSWIFDLEMKVITRLVVVFGLIIGLSFIVSHLTEDKSVWPTNIPYLVNALLGALPIAIFVGSRVRFDEVFAFGTIRNGEGRITTASKLALIATAPLRMLCIVGFVIWCAVLRDYFHYFYELNDHFGLGVEVAERYLAITGFLAVYLLSALYLSYRSPRPAALICLGFALNLPLTAIAVVATQAHLPVLEGLNEPFSTMCFVLAISMAICVAARVVVALVGPTKIKVRSPSEIYYQTSCLGAAFQSWQAAHEELMQGVTK